MDLQLTNCGNPKGFIINTKILNKRDRESQSDSILIDLSTWDTSTLPTIINAAVNHNQIQPKYPRIQGSAGPWLRPI